MSIQHIQHSQHPQICPNYQSYIVKDDLPQQFQHPLALYSTPQQFLAFFSGIQHSLAVFSSFQHYIALSSNFQHYLALSSNLQHYLASIAVYSTNDLQQNHLVVYLVSFSHVHSKSHTEPIVINESQTTLEQSPRRGLRAMVHVGYHCQTTCLMAGLASSS